MQPNVTQEQTVVVTGLSNREFLELHARPGRIGLSGGVTLIDQVICRAERHLDERAHWGAWSHAFLFQGQRLDGHHWVIESDLQVHHKHIQLGVQENRISKYFDEEYYLNLAVVELAAWDIGAPCPRMCGRASGRCVAGGSGRGFAFGSSFLGGFEGRVIHTQVVLGGLVARARGAAEPFDRLAHILQHAPAGFVT